MPEIFVQQASTFLIHRAQTLIKFVYFSFSQQLSAEVDVRNRDEDFEYPPGGHRPGGKLVQMVT